MNTNPYAESGPYATPPSNSEDLARWTADLVDREARLRLIIETEPECVKLLSADGKLLEMNPAGLRMIEADSFQQVAHCCVYPLVTDEHRAEFQKLTERVFQGESGTLEFRIVGLKGGHRWLETHAAPLRDPSGNVTALLGLTRDITGRKNAELEAQSARKQMNQVFERVTDAFVALDRNWVYTYVNAKAGELFGKSPEDLIGKHIWTEFPEWIGQPFQLASERAMAEQSVVSFEEYYEPWKRWFENIVHPSEDGVSIYFRDITERKQTEAALRNSEERLRLALMAANQGLYDLNVQTGDALVSPEYATMLGYDPAEFKETNSRWIERVHPDDLEKVGAIYQAYIEGRVPVYQVEFRQRTRTGGWKWILSLGKIVERDAQGRPLRMLGTHTDITDRKRAEDLLRAKEEHLTSLVHSIDGVVWETDARTMQATYVSPRAERMLGYPLEKWIEEPSFWINHVHPDDRERVHAYNIECTRKNRGHEFEYRMIAADGREVWVHDVISVVVEDGHPSKLRGIMVDITAQKTAELQIRKLNRTYAVLNAINQLIVRAETAQEVLDGACRLAVEKGEFLLGWIGLTNGVSGPLELAAHSGATADTLAVLRRMFVNPGEGCAFTSRAMATGSRSVCNDIEVSKDAESWREHALARGYKAMASFPLIVEGRCIGAFNLYAGQTGFFDGAELNLLNELAIDIAFAIGSLRHVQERHRAEAALRESEERYMLAERAVNDGLWDWNIDTGDDYLSARWKEILGFSDGELPNHQSSFFDRIHPDDVAGVSAVAREHINGGRRFSTEFRMRHKDGTYRWVLSRGEVVRDSAGRAVRMVGAMTDITESRKANEALLRREEHFRRLIENASDLITAVNKRGVITYQSPAAMRSLGYQAEEMVGRNWSEFMHPDDSEAMEAAMVGLVTGKESSVSVECRVRHKSGVWRVFQSVGRSAPDESTEGFVIVNSRDITETRQLEEQLRQSQKMEAIGQLAGGVAHDFNNILAAIIMQAEVASLAQNVPEEVQEGLMQVCGYAERAATLIRQLLLFSRRQVMQARDLNINEVIAHLAQMLQRIIGEDIRLELDLHPSALTVRADSGMIDQVLLNLAVNARDAMQAGGHLKISTTAQLIDSDFTRLHPDAAPGHYVCVSVSDTGVGIHAEILPRIFEPFFTTKELGKGTGLGLATIFGIVKQHTGWIEVTSKAGAGATFRIFLPAIGLPEKALITPARQSMPSGGTETILLVEDEPSVRELTRKILKRFGYEVIEACSGVDALNSWTTCRDSVALVLTDLVMPGGVSGHQLAARLLADRPELKVIFMSGYSAEIAGRELEVGIGDRFIQKPFLPKQLLEIIRATLDSSLA